MKKQIEHILLGILWLLAATLGTSFWFNTQFGFNIFSAQHWQYLAYLQAVHMPVRASFYISLVVAIFIIIIGMYILMRPRFKKIRFPIKKFKKDAQKSKTESVPDASVQNHTTPTMAQPTNVVPAPTVKNTQPAIVGPTNRPPRLNIPTITPRPQSPVAMTQSPMPSQIITNAVPTQNWDDVKNIFTGAGYTIKTASKISGVQMELIAIGTNENLWIGAENVATTDMRRAADSLTQIFTDTLDDIYININAFVLNATDAPVATPTDILMFNNIDQLREYMAQHPNPPLPDDDAGNFDAYSTYIDTVISYIRKL